MRAEDAADEAIRQTRSEIIEANEMAELAFKLTIEAHTRVLSTAFGPQRERMIAGFEALSRRRAETRARALEAIASSRRWEP